MTDLMSLGSSELLRYRSELMERYREFQSRNLDLDMTRGKPCPEQLDLSLEMFECVDAEHYRTLDGVDCRNYGGVDGILEARDLFSQYLEVEQDEIVIGGNSSLNLMHDTIISAMGEITKSEIPMPESWI